MTTSRAEAELVVRLINEHLIGARITGAEFSPAPDEDGAGYDGHWYRINLEKNGDEFYFEPSIDPEGNAPGFLFMEV